MEKKKVVIYTLIVLSILTVMALYVRFSNKNITISVSDLTLTTPYTDDANKMDFTVIYGHYTGERNTTVDSNTVENLEDINTKQFFLYGYNSIPTVKGKKTDLWIENREENEYTLQCVIVDPSTSDIIYISPTIEPGWYVENQKLLKNDVEVGKGYEVMNCLYSGTEGNYELAGVSTSSITFNKK